MVEGKRPPCLHEDRVRWWKSIHNNWICGLCHPPAAPHLAVEWMDIEGVSGAILSGTKVGAIDGGPKIKGSELQAMWQAFGRGQFSSLEFEKVLRRLSFRWDADEKRWHYVTLTEEQGRSVDPRFRNQSKT